MIMNTTTITIKNIKASAKALAFENKAGGLGDLLIADGLHIENSSISFPVELLNSVTFLVTDRWDILNDEAQFGDEDSDDRNERMALKRLMIRLNKIGGVDDLDPKYDR
jgi:hypothetical protein